MDEGNVIWEWMNEWMNGSVRKWIVVACIVDVKSENDPTSATDLLMNGWVVQKGLLYRIIIR